MSDVPQHMAIIMDGNRRWAQQRLVNRVRGHEAGVEALRRTVRACTELGVGVLTVYAFSSENWKRPKWETDGLFGLLARYLVNERPTLVKDGVRLSAIGRRDRIPALIVRRLEETEALTRELTTIHLRLAIDYGGRAELADAARELARRVTEGVIEPDSVDENTLDRLLRRDGVSDPDLIIRTAGERRLSNFLAWQSCYSELHFAETLWPDFGAEDVERALEDYRSRERRFGGRPGEAASGD